MRVCYTCGHVICVKMRYFFQIKDNLKNHFLNLYIALTHHSKMKTKHKFKILTFTTDLMEERFVTISKNSVIPSNQQLMQHLCCKFPAVFPPDNEQ